MYIAFFWRKNTGFVDRIYLYYIRIHIKDYVTRSTSFALLFVVSLKSAELHQVHAPLSGTVRYGHEIKLSLLVIIQTGNAYWGATILQQHTTATYTNITSTFHAFRLFKLGHQFWRGDYEAITPKSKSKKYLAVLFPKDFFWFLWLAFGDDVWYRFRIISQTPTDSSSFPKQKPPAKDDNLLGQNMKCRRGR